MAFCKAVVTSTNNVPARTSDISAVCTSVATASAPNGMNELRSSTAIADIDALNDPELNVTFTVVFGEL